MEGAYASGQEGGAEEALGSPWPEGEVGEAQEEGCGEGGGGEEEITGVNSEGGAQPSCSSRIDIIIAISHPLHSVDVSRVINRYLLTLALAPTTFRKKYAQCLFGA